MNHVIQKIRFESILSSTYIICNAKSSNPGISMSCVCHMCLVT